MKLVKSLWRVLLIEGVVLAGLWAAVGILSIFLAHPPLARSAFLVPPLQAPEGSWSAFEPSRWVNTTPLTATARITATNTNTLSLPTAQYRFTNTGNLAGAPWITTNLTAVTETAQTARVTVTNLSLVESGVLNQIQFGITDTANAAITGTFVISMDQSAPGVTIFSPTVGANLRGGSPYVLGWRADDAGPAGLHYETNNFITVSAKLTDWVTLVITSGWNGPSDPAASFGWTVPLSNTNDALVKVEARDRAQNVGSTTVTFTIDSLTPTVSITNPTGASQWAGGSPQPLQWYAADPTPGAGLTIPRPIALSWSGNSGATWNPITVTANTGLFTWTVPLSDTSQAHLRVEALDKVGHTGVATTEAFIIDSTPPGTPSRPLPAPLMWTGVNSFTLTWGSNPSDPSGIGGVYYSPTLPLSDTGATFFTGDVTSIGVTVPGHGEWTPYIWLRDGAGNSDPINNSTSPLTATLKYDALPPTVALTTPLGGELLAGGATFTITWSAADAGSGLLTTPITLTLLASPDQLITTTANTGSYPWAVPLSNTTTARIRLDAGDQVGHSSAVTTSVFTIDSITPTLVITPSVGPWAGGSTQSIAWGAQDAAPGSGLTFPLTITLFTDQGTLQTFTRTQATGQVAFSVPLTDTTSAQVTAQVGDRAGHLTTTTTSSFIIDATSPTLTLSASPGPIKGGNPITVTWSITDPVPGAGLVTPYTFTLFTNPVLAVLTSTESSGTLTFTAPLSDTDQARLRGEGRDEVGHTGILTTSASIIDSTPPTTTITANAIEQRTSFRVSWSATDNLSGVSTFDVDYRVWITGTWTPWLTATSVLSATFGPLEPTPVRGGTTYFFRGRATDAVGNQGSFVGAPVATVTVPLFRAVIPVGYKFADRFADWSTSRAFGSRADGVANASETLVYTTVVTNTGDPKTADMVTIQNPIPTGTSFVAGDTSWSGRVAAGESVTLTLQVAVSHTFQGTVTFSPTVQEPRGTTPIGSVNTFVPLANGNFDAGSTGWSFTDLGLGGGITTLEGNTVALLGTVSARCEDGSRVQRRTRLEQSIIVPDLPNLKLRIRYRIFSYDSTAPGGDTFKAFLGGTEVLSDGGPLGQASCTKNPDLGWKTAEISLESYRGTTITLALQVFHGDAWYNTYTYVDYIQITQ